MGILDVRLRYAELFAGVGGLSLGLHRAAWDCAFHAEIDPFAQRVLEARFPGVPLYGDVKDLRGAELRRLHGDVDLLSGGSPCQGMSQAGLRAGIIDDVRSSLFFEQMRLWKELECEYLLWENVCGALSSSQGEDFRYVLSAFVGADIGRAVDGEGRVKRWANSGVVRGPAGVAAWRVLDAQHWGVPQRRRRVFVLGSRTGAVDPSEVLFERKGLFGNSQARGTAREEDARCACGRTCDEGGDESDRSNACRCGAGESDTRHGGRKYISFNAHSNGHDLNRKDSYVTPPIKTGDDDGAGSPPAVLSFQERGREQGTAGRALECSVNLAYCLNAGQGGGRGNERNIVVFDSKQSGESMENVAPTLRAMSHSKSHMNGGGQLAVVDTTIVFDTVQITNPHNRSAVEPGQPCPSISATSKVHVARMQAFGQYTEDGTASAIKARDWKDVTDIVFETQIKGQTVRFGTPRRLMPVETERLMSWPAGHTDVPDAKGKAAKDAPRYKACGNGVVSNCVEWIGRRLREAELARRLEQASRAA